MPAQRRRRGDAAHQIRRPAHEVLRRAHVAPVAGVDVAADLDPFGEQRGEHFTLDRDLAAMGNPVDDLAREHIAARVDLVGRRILGLLQKSCDTAIFGRYTAECPRVSDPYQVQGQIGLLFMVIVQQLPQIGSGEHIAVEDHRGVVAQPRRDVGDAAAGAQRVLLGHVFDLQAQLGPVAELLLERRGVVRRAKDDVLDTGRGDPGQQMGEERQPRGGQQRLGRRQGQRTQPGAFAADQDHRHRLEGSPPSPPFSHVAGPPAVRRAPSAATRTASPPRMAQRSGARRHPECRSAR